MRICRPNILWCSIDIKWVFMRIAIVYGPAWICITTSLCMYALVGIEIFKKRAQLVQFAPPHEKGRQTRSMAVENPYTDYKTTQIEVSSEPVGSSMLDESSQDAIFDFDNRGTPSPLPAICQHSRPRVVTIIGTDPLSAHSDNSVPVLSQSPQTLQQRKQKRAAVEFNTAALAYTKVAMLFYVSMLITWIPPSINRFNSLLHPHTIHVGSSFATGVTLPLMGFWNSVIYIVTSWNVVRNLFAGKLSGSKTRPGSHSSVSRPTLYGSRKCSESESAHGLA